MADNNEKVVADASNNAIDGAIDPELASLNSDENARSVASVDEGDYSIVSAARRTSEMLQELGRADEQPFPPQIQAYQSLCKVLGTTSTVRARASNAMDGNVDIGSYPRHPESTSTSAQPLRKLPDPPTSSSILPGSAFGPNTAPAPAPAQDVWWVVLKGLCPGIYLSVDVAEHASGGLADTRIIPSLSLREATSFYLTDNGNDKGKGRALFAAWF